MKVNEVKNSCKITLSTIEKFLKRVDIKSKGECWNWKRKPTKQGYGHFWFGGFYHRAHRISWRITNGDIPDGLCILHKCDNRLCCNPDHLFPGTDKDNNDDKFAKGRENLPIGEKHWKAKLSESDVRDIRKRFEMGQKCVSIASEFGIATAYVYRIVTGTSWSHIPEGIKPAYSSNKFKTHSRPLTKEQKHEVLKLYAKGVSQKAIAAMFVVHQCTISRAVHGRSSTS